MENENLIKAESPVLSKGAVSGWQNCKYKFPEEKQSKALWDNEDLLLIKWNKHNSIEIAVLTRINGALIWEMPDHGYAEINEVDYWMQIPACH